MENKTICPICGTTERLYIEENKENNSLELMCLTCGFITDTHTFKIDSDSVKQYEKSLPKLFIDIKYIDLELNSIWYPLFINNEAKGIVFADGTDKSNWQWAVGKMVVIPIFERVKFEIPNQPGKYYEKRVDMENIVHFKPNEFYLACEELGIDLNKVTE